jgi:hypothetical protein
MNHRIQNISKNLKTQDNRCTGDPIFIVEKLVRDYGYTSDYSEKYVWFDNENPECEISDVEAIKILNQIEDLFFDWDNKPETITIDEQILEYDSRRFQRIYYQDRWEFVQPFFTKVGAENYLKVDGHNLGETRIYVMSGYRNFEMQDVRRLLMEEENE